jgi:hypothetical protein
MATSPVNSKALAEAMSKAIVLQQLFSGFQKTQGSL